MKKCHSCSRELSLEVKIGRKEECPHCHADLHCCLNCRFYDKTASKQCREPIAEPVREKQKANYCDFFQFADSDRHSDQALGEKSRKDLEDLFKR